MSLSRSASGRLGRLLGWLSLGLGTVLVTDPEEVSRFVGLKPTERTRSLMRRVGIQELLMGAGLIRRKAPAALLWGRLIGDVAHIGMLLDATGNRRNDRDRVRTTIGALVAVAFVDLVAAVRASRPSATGPPLRASGTVTVNCDADTAYGHWRDLENLSGFMAHVRSVETRGGGASHWVVDSPAGPLEWDAQIERDLPGHALAWRSVPGADVANAGVVRFAPAPGDRGTEVTVDLEFVPPGGRFGARVAKLLGEHPEQQIRDDLRRFKQVLEVGEVVRTEGSPDGTRSQRMVGQRPGRPPGWTPTHGLDDGTDDTPRSTRCAPPPGPARTGSGSPTSPTRPSSTSATPS